VLPFYYFFDNYIGGQFDVYSSFGITITHQDYLAVENGKVVFQAVNPDLKEPLKWLQELYREGLTPPECFTDDWNTYLTKNAANPPIIGSYGGFNNRNYASQVSMPPLQSPNGKKPVMRRQAYVPNIANAFAVFANNPDPVAAIKFAEFVAFDLEAKMNHARGMKDVFWKFESDGRVSQIFWEESPDKMTANAAQMGVHNSSLGLWDHAFYNSNFRDLDLDIPKSRSWAFENIYKRYLGPEGSVYVAANLTADEENMMKLYNTDLTNLRKQTFARWITTNANIDAEWDAYVNQMRQLHITEFVALKQKAYDAIMAK
jgi:putative aldouronate transport system substrate-binding protein